jgi:hypothetical protein
MGRLVTIFALTSVAMVAACADDPAPSQSSDVAARSAGFPLQMWMKATVQPRTAMATGGSSPYEARRRRATAISRHAAPRASSVMTSIASTTGRSTGPGR